MENINLIDIISLLFVFICLLLAIFLFIVKTEHRLSNKLFAIFLTLLAIDNAHLFTNPVFDVSPNLGLFIRHMAFLQMPVFYLYILSVCYSDFKIKKKHLLHSIPLLIVILIFSPDYYTVDFNSKIAFLENIKSTLEFKFTHIFVHIQIAVYLFFTFKVLRKFRKLYLENYTNSGTQTYKWLSKLTLFITVFYSVVLLKNIFKFSNYEAIFSWAEISVSSGALIIICWFVLMALNHPDLFRGVSSKFQLVNDLIAEVDINIEENKNIDSLKAYMVKEEPFLDSELTIQSLSDKVDIPVRDLSILINHNMGQHFFDFVNQYRIEKAKNILKDPLRKKYTVLEILYEVGFNSKSSFNTAFKKYTGITPTNYRKSSLNKL